MKMPKEFYEKIKSSLATHISGIEQHANNLKQVGGYNDFKTRLAWDCLNCWFGTEAICELYEHGLNNAHIHTALFSIMRELGIKDFQK